MSEWRTPDDQPAKQARREISIWPASLLFAFLICGQGWVIRPVEAHPGGLAADGCHNDRKNGGRHCHRRQSAGPGSGPTKSSGSNVYYPNCSAARAAGVAPVRRGDPGYGKHLDRDNDGVGCE